MHSEKLNFQNEECTRLAAQLDVPSDGKPTACALIAHCFTCSKKLKAVGHISRALAQAGFGVLRFDFTGLGESEGDFCRDPLRIERLRSRIRRAVETSFLAAIRRSPVGHVPRTGSKGHEDSWATETALPTGLQLTCLQNSPISSL